MAAQENTFRFICRFFLKVRYKEVRPRCTWHIAVDQYIVHFDGRKGYQEQYLCVGQFYDGRLEISIAQKSAD